MQPSGYFSTRLNLDAVAVTDEAVKNTITMLERVKRSLKIYTDESHFQLYHHPRFEKALVACADVCRKSGSVVQIVIGPILPCYILNGRRVAPLAKLASQGVIELYYRPTRGQGRHFWIIDDGALVVEPYHQAGMFMNGDGKGGTILKHPSSTQLRYYSRVFSRYAIKSRLMLGHDQPFVLLKAAEARNLIVEARRCGLNYNRMTGPSVHTLVTRMERKLQRENEIIARSSIRILKRLRAALQ